MADGVDARLKAMGIVLPAPPTSGGNYLPARTIGRVVYLAGVISTDSDGVIAGTVGLIALLKTVTPPHARALLHNLRFFGSISGRSMQCAA